MKYTKGKKNMNAENEPKIWSTFSQTAGTEIPRIARNSRYNSRDRPVLQRVPDNPGLQFVRLREMDTHYVEYT